ncbi:ORC ubiquitin ligase 1-like [Liolophura sinensis]|uniref:ORC ubiquitin ligase 1-like n=1 Tax=Liolophura sinensis TaxID=3198878 RepID=UPI00315941C7
MAVNVNNAQRSSTIAFTLPISCQICLGKVKHPLLCPNNHVFCSSCMEVWLERNKQCPACRTPIDDENPCREIRGGVSMVDEEDRGSMNTAELRRARFEMLFKDYELELSRTQAKMEALKVENTALQQQLEIKASAKNYAVPQIKEPDIDALAVITKKFEDANKQYEKVKQEVNKFKKANEELKEENDLLVRENQRLRMEICSRSPHRYGRSTVAALQSQIDSYEKEVHQLNKALQKSDGYIEELEEELSELRGTESEEGKSSDSKPKQPSDELQAKPVEKQSHKKKLFMDYDDVKRAVVVAQPSGESLSRHTAKILETKSVSGILVNNDSKDSTKPFNSPTKGSKKVSFALPEDTPPNSKMSSFDLEMPSPFSQSSTDDPESKETTPSTVVSSSAEFATDNQRKQQEIVKYVPEEKYSTERKANTAKESVKSSSEQGIRSSSKDLNDTLDIENELDELDISVTPELRDCMKLFSMAERKVQERNSLGGGARGEPSADSPLEQPSPVVKATKNKSIKQTNKSLASSRNDFQTIPSELSDQTFSSNHVGHIVSSHMSDQRSTGLSSVDPRSCLSASLDSYKPTSLQSSSSFGSSLRGDYTASGVDRVTTDRHLSSESTTAGVSCALLTGDKTSITGSVVSQVLRSTPQFTQPSAPGHKSSMDSATFLLSQSLSKPSTSSVNHAVYRCHGAIDSSSQPGTFDSTSALSQSVVTNNKSTDSLTSSLWKLEQTLAAHRASNSHVPRQTSYPAITQIGAIISGIGEPHITSTSSYSLSAIAPPLPSAIAPPLPSASGGLSSLNALPFTSGSHLPSFTTVSLTLPPPISNIPGATSLAPLSYTSAVPVSSGILYGQSNDSTNGFQPRGSGQAGFSNWTNQTGLAKSNSYPAPEQSSVSFSQSIISSGSTHPMSSHLHSEKVNNYSYVSNSSMNSNVSTLDGSFLPEPKKRLFETDTDDTDMSFSPVKSSKLSF